METKVRSLIKEAMIEKNKNKQITYKSILETAQKMAKETNSEVTNENIIAAVKKEIKQLSDLLGFCQVGSDKYVETTRKIDYCMNILPKMASPEELILYLKANKIEKNMGICMKTLKEHFGSMFDGKIANTAVRDYINT